MEITQTNALGQPSDLFDRRFQRWASFTSIALGLAGAGLMLASILARGGQGADMTLLQGAWMALFALTAIAGANLLRGCLWSQRLLLVFWLAALLLAMVLGIAALAWGTPTWWQAFAAAPLPAVLAPVLALSAAQSVLLVKATADNTRLRYGALVIVAVAAVSGLVLAVNIAFQKYPYQKDLETLGQYGLSNRTKRILEKIDEPVQLTIIYTATDKERRGTDFRDNVVEIAQAMQREAQKSGRRTFNVVNVASDSDRAQILARLQKQSASAAPAHMALLTKFTAAGDKWIKDLTDQQATWQEMPADSFVALWGVPAYLQDSLGSAAQEIKRVRDDVQQQLSRNVPDVPRLVGSVGTALKDTRDDLRKVTAMIEKIAKLPEAIAANRTDALQAVQDAQKAVQAIAKTLGQKDGPAPADPTAALKNFVKAATEANNAMSAAGKKLTDLAGKDNAALLAQSRLWGFTVQDQRTGMEMRSNMGQMFVYLGRNLQALAAQAEEAAGTLKSEAQAKYIQEARIDLAEAADVVDSQSKAVAAAINKLSAADAASTALFKQVADKKLFSGLLGPIDALAQSIEKLPEIKPSTLSQDITGENIVLVEMGDKPEARRIEAVPFDSVWPLKFRGPFQMSSGEGADKRVFNGDTAIASKLLTLSARKPFATVYVCYVAPPLPPQMAQMKFNPDLRPWNTIVDRLKESNFEIKEWNLNEPMPEAEPTPDAATQASQKANKLPKVLLVLPFPPQNRMMPNPYGPPPTAFTPAHVEKVRQELDAGTAALVLTQFGAEGMEELLKYFQSDWGAHVQAGHMVFTTTPDEATPGKFRLDMRRLYWMPLNNFAAQPPVGLPLRTQRVLWQGLCPIEKSPVEAKVEGKPIRTVDYQPLLSVPEARNVWALAEQNVQPLVSRLIFQQGASDLVSPDYANGDLRSPFDVAVALSGPQNSSVKIARVILASMGQSLTDPHMQRRVEEKDGKFSDPPRANADFVPNSVYWLVGLQDYIGSGPAQIQPVEIAPGQMRIVWPLVVVVLPLLVLGAGGLVLMVRRGK